MKRKTITKDQAIRTEAFALRLSAVGHLLMGALGVGFALLTRPEAVLFDGVYSLVNFVMALIAERVASLMEESGSDSFHWWRT